MTERGKKKSKTDEMWMKQALHLAEKGRRLTSPNPMVGALVVKNGRLISQGYHRCFGGDHAEIEALQKAGRKARGATLYVTLEPCSSWGKTPPCVDSVVRSGIREVVIGALDPNPQNHGRSLVSLKKKGILVRSGILAENVRHQNGAFFKWVQTGLPFVILKMAQTLDGKIASAAGSSRWISSPPAREFVHSLRAGQDAVLVGKNTLFCDDPFLSPRTAIQLNPGKPWRVALDPEGKVSSKARIFQGDQLTVMAVSEKTALNPRLFSGCPKAPLILPLPEKKGRLDLKRLLQKLGELGAAKLLVEGGGELAWSLIREGWVDLAYWIVAPKFLGGRKAKTSVEGDGFPNPGRVPLFQWKSIRKIGTDLLFEIPLSIWGR